MKSEDADGQRHGQQDERVAEPHESEKYGAEDDPADDARHTLLQRFSIGGTAKSKSHEMSPAPTVEAAIPP